MLKKFPTSLLVLLAWCAAAMAAETQYRHPSMVIPYAWDKPVVDGVVNDAEWQGAISHQALQTTSRRISTRQARFWMMWDEENLYFAMRSPLRKGERPIQQHRERGRDVEAIFDDCYEIWVSAGATDALTGQLNCTTQFLSNFSGAAYDVLHQPDVGNSRTSSYQTNWQPQNRINERNEWECEVLVPRTTLGITAGPFHDGQRIRCLLARDFKRPWEQCSFEGTSTYAVVETHSAALLSKTLPAVQLLSVGDSAAGKLGLHLAACGQADGTIRWRYASDDVVKEGQATLRKGVSTDIVDLPDLDRPGPGSMRITVTDADGTTLLDWSAQRNFELKKERRVPAPGEEPVLVEYNPATEVLSDRGDVLDLRVAFNAERDYLRVFGDLINYDNRDAIGEITISVSDADGRTMGRSRTTIDPQSYARDVLHFERLPPGEYSVLLECKDTAGKTLASKDSRFTKENLAAKYDWWDTPCGNIERVISPWTPVTFRNGEFGVWGREMAVGPAGLPSRVRTQRYEILAAPARLIARTADGGELAATGYKTQVLFDRDHRKQVRVSSALGDINVSSNVTVEFDGMYKVEMTLAPKQATTVESLQVVLPYAESMAEYIHAVTSEIRSGFYYGYTPGGRGRVWDCTLLGDKTMQVGSFIPYIWLGSTRGGLCWFADSDQGWIPNDQTPAIEIQRNIGGQVDLVFNLIGEKTVLDQPRTITFALQASPVKPMHPGWREDNWWCGDTFKQYAHTQNLIFASVPFAVPSYVEESKKMVEQQHKAGKPAVPYFIHTVLPKYLVPELKDLAEQWETPYGSYGSNALCYNDSLIDFMVHNWSKWSEQCGIDGYYVDNMVPLPCYNHEHGCGYRLPNGRIQPSFQMFGTREYFLRSRAAFLEQRPASRLVLHMTNCMVIPWVGAADVAYDGEHHVIYPEMKKDFMDFWTLERLRVDFPAQWGTAVNFMHEYQGNWDPVDLHRSMRAYFAAVMLHDALPTGNNNGHARNLTQMRVDFGIGSDDVRFLAYWDETGIAAANTDVKLAGWLKSDKLLLLVANFGEQQTASVNIDSAKLGWGKANLTVTDAEFGYQQFANRQVQKTAEELAAERVAWEEREATRIEGLRQRHERQSDNARRAGEPAPEAPDLTLRPCREQPYRNERVLCWDGDQNKPVRIRGTQLSVPVERHNFRLLIVEKR
jgi:hypothetical protein